MHGIPSPLDAYMEALLNTYMYVAREPHNTIRKVDRLIGQMFIECRQLYE